MKTITLKRMWAILVLLIGLGLNGCKTDAETDPFVPTRYFAPGGVTVSAPNVTVTLRWNRPLYVADSEELTYTVEVARDASFGQVEKRLETTETSVTFSRTELSPGVDYVARIRVNSSNGIEASVWSVSPSFSLVGE